MKSNTSFFELDSVLKIFIKDIDKSIKETTTNEIRYYLTNYKRAMFNHNQFEDNFEIKLSSKLIGMK